MVFAKPLQSRWSLKPSLWLPYPSTLMNFLFTCLTSQMLLSPHTCAALELTYTLRGNCMQNYRLPSLQFTPLWDLHPSAALAAPSSHLCLLSPARLPQAPDPAFCLASLPLTFYWQIPWVGVGVGEMNFPVLQCLGLSNPDYLGFFLMLQIQCAPHPQKMSISKSLAPADVFHHITGIKAADGIRLLINWL